MTSHNAREPVEAIPGDVMKIAEDALDNVLCHDVEAYGGSYEEARQAAIQDIAKAIHEAVMAERERCASLLDGTSIRLRAERPGDASAIIADILIECADVLRMSTASKTEGE